MQILKKLQKSSYLFNKQQAETGKINFTKTLPARLVMRKQKRKNQSQQRQSKVQPKWLGGSLRLGRTAGSSSKN
jgi:hypothetical protein